MKAVFLDRDGVINRNTFYQDTAAHESPRTVADFALFSDALPSLQRLQHAGYSLFLVSNQPNVAKAKSTLQELQDIHLQLVAALAQAKVHFVEFFYCYHHPDSSVPIYGGPCECRKPSPYFLLKAAEDHCLDLGQSWMVGDRLSDIECGKRAGARTVLVVRDPFQAPVWSAQSAPGHVAASLSEATDWILRQPCGDQRNHIGGLPFG